MGARIAMLMIVVLFASEARATEVELLPSGVALPYPTDRLFRGFGACRGRGGAHRHAAIDLGGVGPESGIGTPVRSMTNARVTMIGLASVSPKQFGTPDRRRGHARRRGHSKLERTKSVVGYGDVHFFSARRGRWRSGNIIALEATDGPLAGATIRYMHLGAVRPGLVVGSVVRAGEELGLLGGTGVQSAAPHVHIDVVDREGMPVDVAPLIGLEPTARCGPPAVRARLDAGVFEAMVGLGLRYQPLAWGGPLGVVMLRPTVHAIASAQHSEPDHVHAE